MVYSSFTNLVMNAHDRVAFRGTLAGPGVTSSNSDAIVVEGASGFSLAARQGDHAAGLAPGVLFGNFADPDVALSGQQYPTMNALGQVAFYATLTGTGVDATDDRSIWVFDGSSLYMIARTGDVMQVSPGVFKTISDLEVLGNSGNEEGRRSSFNDIGMLTYRATFTDGAQGIFITVIPEPALAMPLVIVGVACWRRRGSADARSKLRG
jgi:hypothetical protein